VKADAPGRGRLRSRGPCAAGDGLCGALLALRVVGRLDALQRGGHLRAKVIHGIAYKVTHGVAARGPDLHGAGGRCAAGLCAGVGRGDSRDQRGGMSRCCAGRGARAGQVASSAAALRVRHQ
jgi:hypothetical protein